MHRTAGFNTGLTCLVVMASSLVAAEQPETRQSTYAPVDWKLERVTLSDGKTYQGLVQSEGRSTVEFLEVRRPRGKPMSLVVRPIDRTRIARLERLAPDEQQILRGKLEKHRHRAVIEGRDMESLVLEETQHEGASRWRYEGRWFVLDSTADELMTRRVIVRLGQIFTAYRQLLPARDAADGRVHIEVFGASDDYRAAITALGLRMQNPAVFLPDKNLILAGSDLNRFSAELAQVNREHRQAKARFDKQMAEVPARLKQLGADLKANDIPNAERMKILLAESKKWDDQRKAMRRKIATIDRRNAALFNEVAGKMFRRLAHEAFHAYLAKHVYPRPRFDVPRWLNEGLAQVFEAGLLEADSLRIDAPNVAALAGLQSDLRGPMPLPLAELLQADAAAFFSTHADSERSSSRLYWYSWGLAYYLAFEQNIFPSAELDEYLSENSAGTPPVERFEKMVQMPLEQFENRWRAAIIALKNTP